MEVNRKRLFSLHAITRSLLGNGFVSYVVEKKDMFNKKNWISAMLQFFVCILHGFID